MNKKEEKGITLVILIITVIILLILAGVTIDLAIDGSLFSKAEEVSNGIQEKADEHEQMTNEIRNLYK